MILLNKFLVLVFMQSPTVEFQPVHTDTKFNEPVQAVFDGVDDNHVYVVEKNGVVLRVSLDEAAVTNEKFMDIQDRVNVRNAEEGLLSLAFHPKYSKNNQLVVWYTMSKPKRTVLSRFTVNKETSVVDNDSEEVLLTVRQPWGNHNGGMVLFDEAGMLYVSIGDGGSGGDPHENGQNKSTLLGTIIRINIDAPSGDLKYSIPPDNPFVDSEHARKEIWAWGLRNVWRMAFDRKTGELWASDVGQNKWEEVDIITAGGNYGWNLREGKHDFETGKSAPNLIDPVYEYTRRDGGSITGGYVYRGTQLPELGGNYIFSDYLSKKIWALSKTKDASQHKATQIAKNTPIAISSFSEMPSGEILACGFNSAYTKKGKLYRLVRSSSMTPKMR